MNIPRINPFLLVPFFLISLIAIIYVFSILLSFLFTTVPADASTQIPNKAIVFFIRDVRNSQFEYLPDDCFAQQLVYNYQVLLKPATDIFIVSSHPRAGLYAKLILNSIVRPDRINPIHILSQLSDLQHVLHSTYSPLLVYYSVVKTRTALQSAPQEDATSNELFQLKQYLGRNMVSELSRFKLPTSEVSNTNNNLSHEMVNATSRVSTVVLVPGNMPYDDDTLSLDSIRRVERAVEYVRQHATGDQLPMLLSGGITIPNGRVPESVMMGLIAQSRGLPKHRILLELHATTTHDNAVNGMQLIEQQYPLCNRIVLVSKQGHLDGAVAANFYNKKYQYEHVAAYIDDTEIMHHMEHFIDMYRDEWTRREAVQNVQHRLALLKDGKHGID